MIVTVNGEPRELARGATVATVVEVMSGDATGSRGMAVALEGEVVPRSRWVTTELREGAHVEVVAAIQGG